MKIAITGGPGFVGRNIARRLVNDGHEVVLIARGVDQTNPTVRAWPRTHFHAVGLEAATGLDVAFTGCEAVSHCAGINRESGRQTFASVHVAGTRQVLEAVRRVARVTGRRPWMFPLPVWFHYALGWCLERFMTVPLVSVAQVRMLTEEQIRTGLPAPRAFTLRDIRCCHEPRHARHHVFFEMPLGAQSRQSDPNKP